MRIVVIAICAFLALGFDYKQEITIPDDKASNLGPIQELINNQNPDVYGLTYTDGELIIHSSSELQNADLRRITNIVKNTPATPSKYDRALEYLKTVDISDGANVDQGTLKRVLRATAIVNGIDKEDV